MTLPDPASIGSHRRVGGRTVPVTKMDLVPRKPVALCVTRPGDKDVGVLLVFKAASRSMVNGREQHVLSGGNESPRKLHVFVRDPIDRLASAYKFFRGRPPIDYPEDGAISWERFVDLVLDEGKENPHWRSVTDTIALAGGGKIIPHMFERLSEEFPLGELERRNESPVDLEQSIDRSYRSDELKAAYAGDYELRERVRDGNSRRI